MARRFFAELNVDEDKYIAQTDGDVGIGDYLDLHKRLQQGRRAYLKMKEI